MARCLLQRGAMSLRLAALVMATAIAGCATDGDPDTDPVLDNGKADGGDTPILKGTLPLSGTQDVTFVDASGDAVDLTYFQFELSGNATVSLSTQAPSGVTATVYFYKPNGETWGKYLDKHATSLSASLGAGTYRALVKIKGGKGNVAVPITATCTGSGCALPQIGCTDLTARSQTPDLFVGPQDWESSIEAAIDSAAGTLDVQMYLFTVTDIAQHIISAYKRGVAVRVLLDPHENNSTVQTLLTNAGVPNHTDPTVFTFAHAKYMVIDGTSAVILSGNFNAGAVDTTDANGERNYGFVDHDPDDAARLETVFEDDWTSTSGAEPDLSCTRLIVSPVNSKDRILAHVNSAMSTLDIEVLYLDDADVRAAVVTAATMRNVATRIMLSDPSRNPQNTATVTYFQGYDIPIKYLLTNYLHTKMIMADGVALVGSENMSETSLTKNREMGGLIFEPGPAGQVHDQYEQDWSNATDPPAN